MRLSGIDIVAAPSRLGELLECSPNFMENNLAVSRLENSISLEQDNCRSTYI